MDCVVPGSLACSSYRSSRVYQFKQLACGRPPYVTRLPGISTFERLGASPASRQKRTWLRSQLGAEPAKPVRRTVPCSTERIIRAWIQQRRQAASR
jgi:hypothetical protein